MMKVVILFLCGVSVSGLNALEMTVEETVSKLTEFYLDGSAYGADPISQLNHGLQTAFQAQKVYGYSDERVIVGALLHDIGWKLCGYAADGVDAAPPSESVAASLGILTFTSSEEQRARHDVIGGAYLRMAGFPEVTASIAEGHVLAKRYLTYKEPDYFAKLSPGSKRTLEFQGGPMSPEEAETFEKHPSFELFKDSRRWDEGAKQPALNDVVENWDYYKTMIERVLKNKNDSPVDIKPKPFIESPRSTDLIAQWLSLGYVRLSKNEWLKNNNEVFALLSRDVDELESNPILADHSRTFEQTEEVVMSRSERFVDHPNLGSTLKNLLTGGTLHMNRTTCLEKSPLVSVVELLNLGNPVALYKEKVNYKRSGGGGYLPHQDHYSGLGVPSFKSSTDRGFVTFVCMIALDASNKKNGCPEIAPTTWAKKEGWIGYGPSEHEQMETFDDATSDDYKKAQYWSDWDHMGPFEPVEQEEGELLIYDNFMPHRSAKNSSPHKRRALFGVYYDPAHVNDRDLRTEYYGNETKPGGRRHAGSQKDNGKANLFHTGTGVVLPDVIASSMSI